MSGAPLVTFFMIVTDRDILIADHAVRSYAKISGVPFRLVVYSNWVLSSLKQQYFPAWRELPYVEIRDNPEHHDDRKPSDAFLYGPFELCYTVWDRELKTLTDTPYHATVDADFEILSDRFIHAMLERFAANPKLGAIATDYNGYDPAYYDGFSDEVIQLNERWQTHFVMYRREALGCPTSHAYHVELVDAPVPRSVWDDGGWFQRSLRVDMGYELEVLPARYRRDYMHYEAMAHNRHIHAGNIALYRRVKLLMTRGLFRLGDPLTKRVGGWLHRLLFSDVDRNRFVPGWAGDAPGRHRGHPDVHV